MRPCVYTQVRTIRKRGWELLHAHTRGSEPGAAILQGGWEEENKFIFFYLEKRIRANERLENCCTRVRSFKGLFRGIHKQRLNMVGTTGIVCIERESERETEGERRERELYLSSYPSSSSKGERVLLIILSQSYQEQ